MIQIFCRVGVFVICAQMLVHFRPRQSYEKYLKMLVSAMILLQILRPLGALVLGDREVEFEVQVKKFEELLQESVEAAAKSSADVQKNQEKLLVKEAQSESEVQTVEEIQIEVEVQHAEREASESDAER